MRLCRALVAGAALASAWACSSGAPSSDGRRDADTGEPRETGVGDEPDEAGEVGEGDGPALDGSGPITIVTTAVEIATERPCDVDGDGVGDNAVADLGPTSGNLFKGFLDSLIDGAIGAGNRWVLHIPLVESLAVPHDPEIVFIAFSGIDQEGGDDYDDWDPSDDFSGHEAFYARQSHLDACGEPLSYSTGAELLDGELLARSETLILKLEQETDIVLVEAVSSGTVEPRGEGATLTVCGAALMNDLGNAPDFTGAGDLTGLEVLVTGGLAFGIPGLQGLSPDVDRDGDGLERLETDDDGHILRCVDGDGSLVEGRDCWRDERIADGFSLTFELEGTSARFVGLRPGWEEEVEGVCDEPPAESLWDQR